MTMITRMRWLKLQPLLIDVIQIHDEHQRRISEVDQVEKHLMMAKAASLAAEEKKLSSLDQQLGLPKGK